MSDLVDDPVVTDDEGSGSRRRIAPLVVGVLAVVMVGLFVVLASADTSGGGGESATSPLIGRPAPEATGYLGDGTSFDLSRRKGSWVVLNFFDPTCIPCIQEHPDLVRFSEDQETLGLEGAELYSVITRGEQSEIEAFFAENGGDWPAIYSRADEFPVAFGVSQVPETWVIDPSGIVQLRLVSKVTADQLNSILQQFREQYR
ncbi:MAG TPA: TlpA disulfide reductase family protein [Ilumatobacteraceae bacterium]|nr:TlpA disulfide reductase family protein [Ilumatobacteraceae bacterium]